MEGWERLAAGREAEVYLRPDGTVVKLMYQPSAGDRLAREAAACRLLRDHGQRAPFVHGPITVEGRPGLVMDRIDGSDLLATLERQPHRLLAAARVLAETHAAMHECVAPAELPDLSDEIAGSIHAAAPLPDDLRELALGLLADLPRGDRLCHGDFHLANILGSWEAPVVIDWGSASRGDPMADVARTELLHRVGALPPGASRRARLLAATFRRILTDRYLRLYGRQRSLEDILDRWRVVQMAARLREDIPEERAMLLARLRQAAAAVA